MNAMNECSYLAGSKLQGTTDLLYFFNYIEYKNYIEYIKII